MEPPHPENPRTLVVFTEGGKGGVAKTEVAIALVSWYRSRGIAPVLLDFDVENTNKSGLQNFYPEATKLDVHAEGALDEFFEVCDLATSGIVVADLGAGAGKAAYRWFDETHRDASDLGIEFTAIGVTTNDAGAVQSILKWTEHLQRRVKYLIVLNELRDPDCKFEYWHAEAATEEFEKLFSPHIIKMGARVAEFQSEVRNQCATLQDVIDRNVDCPFLKKTKNLSRARRYQRQLFAGFDSAESILLP